MNERGGRTGPPRVLFVAHEATRTGAPMLLLHFLRWLRAHTDVSFEVLVLSDGPLVEDFAAVAPAHVVAARGDGAATYIEAGMIRARLPRMSDRVKIQRLRRSTRHLSGFDGVYLNGADSALALRVLPEIPPVVITHVHEMSSALSYFVPQRDRATMLRETDLFIACSEAVAAGLMGGHGVPRDRVRCHYEFIDPPRTDAASIEAARRELGIPDGAIVVGAGGQVIWRKGSDLFLQLAADVRRRRPEAEVHFVWVGDTTAEDITPVRHDMARLGLSDRVHLTGECRSPASMFANFDIFCLTSREDPFPLVMLEAAMLGVPVVSFANGGAVEFAEGVAGRDAAAIVPYLDVEAMADVVVDLIDDPVERKALGERGSHRVATCHTIEAAAPRLHAELMGALGTQAPRRRR